MAISQQQFLDHLAEMVELPAGSLNGSEKLADLEGWDSMAMMNLIAYADQHFQKAISPRQFTTCETTADLGRVVGASS
jgi:acyl carrier protein